MIELNREIQDNGEIPNTKTIGKVWALMFLEESIKAIGSFSKVSIIPGKEIIDFEAVDHGEN